MSVSLPRLAGTAVSTLVALAVLGAPTAALAAPGDERPGSSRTESASAERSQDSAAAGSASGAAAGRSAATRPDSARSADAQPAGDTRERAEARNGNGRRDQQARGTSTERRNAGQARGADQRRNAGKGAGNTRKPAPSKGKSDASATTGDPRGNNGTFKVDGPVLDTSHGNEPHVDCAFRLNFFGYDAGQLATISFTAVAPTRGGTTTVAGTPVISSTAAKGGLYGGSYPTSGTWTAADLGLDPTQAQHVKVSVESINADGSPVPGGAKHKVFWLEPCAAAATAAAPTAVTAASLPFVGPVATPRQTVVAPAGGVVTAAATAPAADVLGATLTAQAAAPATVVAAPTLGAAFALPQGAARAAVQPTTLPFTGSPQLVALLAGGIVMVAFGGGLVLTARRTA